MTTKNIEKKVQRQLLRGDGLVVEAEVPVITVESTENKETFTTDREDEEPLQLYGERELISSKAGQKVYSEGELGSRTVDWRCGKALTNTAARVRPAT